MRQSKARRKGVASGRVLAGEDESGWAWGVWRDEGSELG